MWQREEQMRVERWTGGRCQGGAPVGQVFLPLLCLPSCLSALRGQYLSEWVKHNLLKHSYMSLEDKILYVDGPVQLYFKFLRQFPFSICESRENLKHFALDFFFSNILKHICLLKETESTAYDYFPLVASKNDLLQSLRTFKKFFRYFVRSVYNCLMVWCMITVRKWIKFTTF